MNLETGGTAFALTESRPAKKLPYKVLEGLNNVMSLTELKVGPRNTLKTLLSYLSKHSTTGEIYTRREKIAARAGCSVPTVNRHIALLRELGVLTVGAQGRIQTPGKRYGDYTVTHIFFTQDFLKQIDWIDDATTLPSPQDTPPAAVETDDTSIKMSAPIYQKLTNPSFDTKRDQRGDTKRKIPADLLAIAERKVWPKSIWKLMGMATRSGHRLAHVWQAVQATTDQLGLTGKRLKRYLEKTIANGGNFAQRASTAIEAARAAAQEALDRAYIKAFTDKYAGKTLSSPDGRNFVQIAIGGGNAWHRIGTKDVQLNLMNRRDIAPILEKLARGDLVVGFVAPPTIHTGTNPSPLGSLVGNKQIASEHLAKIKTITSAGKEVLRASSPLQIRRRGAQLVRA